MLRIHECDVHMIREIHVFKEGQTIFDYVIVPNIDLDTNGFMMLVSSSTKKLQEWKIDSMEIERVRYVYMNSQDTQCFPDEGQ